MNNSGDAAEQVVRLSLEGTEVALKLTGSAAAHIAAALYAVMKNRDKNKTKGRQRLTAMLRSGKELKVFTVSEEHLKQFAKEAKRYGIVYCVLRGREKSGDGLVDVMVRAEDAAKINRIVERFRLATVDAASIKSEIEKSRQEKAAQPAPEHTRPDAPETEKLLDELLEKPLQKEKAPPENPAAARTEKAGKSAPSEPTSKMPARHAGDTADKRPSVRELLREITAGRARKKQAPESTAPAPHKTPRRKKTKER